MRMFAKKPEEPDDYILHDLGKCDMKFKDFNRFAMVI